MEYLSRLLALVLWFFFSSHVHGTPGDRGFTTVCPKCDIHSIAEAISLTRSGGTIRVEAGIYHETGLVLEKPVSIVGDGWPIVDGGGKGTIFTLRADRIRLSGLVIQSSGFSYLDDLAGIKVTEANQCLISGNRLEGTFFAIHVGRSDGCLIENNVVHGTQRSENAAGNGIHAWNVRHLTLRKNEITGHRDGIYFEFVKDSLVEGNLSSRNLRYGLHFMYSDHNEYRENVFAKNASGVAVMYSRNITMTKNHFAESWGGASYGILLKEISASEIRGNVFTGNTVGAYLEGTTRSKIEENVFVKNGWALRILGNCDGNIITHNDFRGNTFDVSTNAGGNMNTLTDNHWDAYVGLDLNHDGFGDTPYHPVRLSSVLMEKFGVSVLLLKSFFFKVADEAESMLPLLTPVALRDDRPLMKPWSQTHGEVAAP